MAKWPIIPKEIFIISDKEKIFYNDLGEAILKYLKNGVGTVYIDDVKVGLFPSKDKWHKASFYFKIKEG